MPLSVTTSFAILGVLFLMPGRAASSTITWSAGTFSNNSVELTQDVLYAVDIGSASAVSDTATGVTFGADNGSHLTESAAHGVSSGSGFLPSGTTGDAALNSILQTADFPSNFTDAITYTLDDLTIGAEYTVELLLADTRPGFNGRLFTASQANGGAPSITETYGFTNGAPAVGGFAIGTFTADAATQSFQIVNKNAPPPTNDGNPDVGGQLNGLILAQAPEPGSLALMSLGLPLLLLLFRRRINFDFRSHAR
jgi:hypothetical protein